SHEPIIRATAPTATAAPSAPPGPALIAALFRRLIALLLALRECRLVLGFIVLGFAFVGGQLDSVAGVSSVASVQSLRLDRARARGPFPRLAGAPAAPAPAPLAPRSFTLAFACRLVGQPLALVSLDLGFGLDVERLVLVIDFIGDQRRSGCLR